MNKISKTVVCLPLSGNHGIWECKIPSPSLITHLNPTLSQLGKITLPTDNSESAKKKGEKPKEKNLNSHSFCISRFPGTHPFSSKGGVGGRNIFNKDLAGV